MTSQNTKLLRSDDLLGVLLPGMGAVASTFVAGVYAIRRGLGSPIGSRSQLWRGMEPSQHDVRRLLPSLDALRFACWDIEDESVYDAAIKAKVLERPLISQLEEELRGIRSFPAVFEQRYVKNLAGPHVKRGQTKMDLADQLRSDIREIKRDLSLSRMVMIWCGSTEIYLEVEAIHHDLDRFERALRESHPAIAPSMIYAYAALSEGVPFANGAPNLTAEIPALATLASERGIPTAGKDFKTGQTLLKTVLAPMLRSRMLGLEGWFSMNILGNRDGEVLDDPESFRTKEASKLGVLDSLLDRDLYPELYGELDHRVRIHYYPPRGDAKESWDTIDLFGWLGYPMQLKVNFLCRDSILAAPIVLDVALFLDLAQRSGLRGPQEWLSFYFKSPIVREGRRVEQALFQQELALEEQLRELVEGALAQSKESEG